MATKKPVVDVWITDDRDNYDMEAVCERILDDEFLSNLIFSDYDYKNENRCNEIISDIKNDFDSTTIKEQRRACYGPPVNPSDQATAICPSAEAPGQVDKDTKEVFASLAEVYRDLGVVSEAVLQGALDNELLLREVEAVRETVKRIRDTLSQKDSLRKSN